MTPLAHIPAKVRLVAYWVGYVVGVIAQGITVVWAAIAAASPDVTMPLALVITSAVLGLAQTQLNLIAGSNVPPPDLDAAVNSRRPAEALQVELDEGLDHGPCLH